MLETAQAIGLAIDAIGWVILMHIALWAIGVILAVAFLFHLIGEILERFYRPRETINHRRYDTSRLPRFEEQLSRMEEETKEALKQNKNLQKAVNKLSQKITPLLGDKADDSSSTD